jgi:mono/diheme cytochrome c family protein
VSAASDHLVRLTINPGTGVPSVASDPSDPTRVHQIFVGKNPRGLAINSTDTRAYVMNYISRSVSVIDLNAAAPSVIATVQSAALPTAGSDADKTHAGKELYNSSTGVFDPAPGTTTPIAGRMSAEGWGSCSSCHPFGLSDGVAWIFASGPRRTIGQHTDFDQTDPARSIMRALNWSAFFDEQEDFENNIRGTSGGLGLIVAADNVTPDTPTPNFTPIANGGRNQLKIRGFGAWDAIKSYVQFGIRTPISPVPATNPDVIAGRALFAAANCQQCHGGAQWTSARVRFIPPPDPALIVNSQIIGELRQVGTFDAAFPNEKRANGAVALGADGLTPASLLGLHSIPEGYLHGSAAATLTDVMNNVTHRASGTGGVDTLANPADRAKVIQFLLSIDASTPIFPQP